jgi:hypothetical protein
MDTSLLVRKDDCEWWIQPFGKMRVPAVIYATEALVRDMDPKVYEQVTNVATLSPRVASPWTENQTAATGGRKEFPCRRSGSPSITVTSAACWASSAKNCPGRWVVSLHGVGYLPSMG